RAGPGCRPGGPGGRWPAGGDQLPFAGRSHRQTVHEASGQGRGGQAAARPADHPQGLRTASEAAGQADLRQRGRGQGQPALAQCGDARGGEAAMSRLYAKPLPPGSLLLAVLFGGVLLSAIAVSYSAHWNRQLLNALYAELSVRDKAQAEWGRLVLEQSTWTAPSRIEALAAGQLRMRIPEPTEVQMVAP